MFRGRACTSATAVSIEPWTWLLHIAGKSVNGVKADLHIDGVHSVLYFRLAGGLGNWTNEASILLSFRDVSYYSHRAAWLYGN